MPRRNVVLAAALVSCPVVTQAAESSVPVAELGAALFVGASRGAAPRAGPTEIRPDARPRARLVWLDPADAARGTEAVVRPEVARLLREAGVEASWRRGEANELARPGELRVIFLNRAAQRGHGFVLGATPTRFQGEAFVWIHVPSVRAAALGSAPAGGRSDLGSLRPLGIALARVIAHEVVHVLAPALPHGRGLMAARFDRALLGSASIPIGPEVALAIRTAQAIGEPEPRTPVTILAAESTNKEP